MPRRTLHHRFASIETLLITGVLFTGAAVFAFPFLWMAATSVKSDREMIAGKLRLLPTTPQPQQRTPYIDAQQFDPPTTPDGVPQVVWERTLPRLVKFMEDTVDRWEPRVGRRGDLFDVDVIDEHRYRQEMIEGLLEVTGEQISDRARHTAADVERRERGGPASIAALPGDRQIAQALGPKAIEAGVSAILDDCRRLTDERTLERVLDRCYRRFSLGPCRLRTRDYRMVAFAAGLDWNVGSGPAELVRLGRTEDVNQEARIDFDRGSTAMFVLNKAPAVPAADVDRVFVSFRGDDTWARVAFEVIRNGSSYRTDEVVNLFDRSWIEIQLRWADVAGDPMQRRTHLILQHAGDAPAGSPPFAVRIEVTKNSSLGAWRDKILRHYRTVFRELPFARYIMTSLALSILNIVLVVFSSTLAAYAFARLRWPGREVCFGIMLATMMIPPQVTMIPSFLLHKQLGWYNSLLPLWVPAAFGAPFFIFLLRQFLKTIPTDLEDAARIDGCGFLRIYWHIMMPLVRPTIAIIAIYTFNGTWNNFMGPLIYVNDDRLFPLALGLFKFNLSSATDAGLMMAGSFVMTLPVVILFFFVQRYFIQGVTLTGLKG